MATEADLAAGVLRRTLAALLLFFLLAPGCVAGPRDPASLPSLDAGVPAIRAAYADPATGASLAVSLDGPVKIMDKDGALRSAYRLSLVQDPPTRDSSTYY